MILVKAGKFYLGYYYKNREAKKKDKKSYFRNIHYMRWTTNGYFFINGKIGERLYMYYTKREAIREYNQECKIKKRGD